MSFASSGDAVGAFYLIGYNLQPGCNGVDARDHSDDFFIGTQYKRQTAVVRVSSIYVSSHNVSNPFSERLAIRNYCFETVENSVNAILTALGSLNRQTDYLLGLNLQSVQNLLRAA